MKKYVFKQLTFVGLITLFLTNSCKKITIEDDHEKTKYLLVEKKNMSFIQKYSGTWCEPCGGWGFTQFASLYDQFGSTEAFGAVVSGNMGSANNEAVFNATQEMYGTDLSGTPSFMCNLKVMQATQGVIELHRKATVIANSNYDLTIVSNKIKIKTTTEFFEGSESKEYYLFPYIIVDEIIANQSGHSDGANTKHKKTIVDVAYPTGFESNSLKGYKIAEGEIKKGYKFNLEFEAVKASAWQADKISIVLVIATKGSDGKYKFINAYTKHS